MQGMTHSVNVDNGTVVSAFHSALLHQLLVGVVILFVLAVAWNVLRTLQYRRAVAEGTAVAGMGPTSAVAEPAARHLLRVSFGLLWVFDGILQAQASMPLGMASGVLQPSAATAPGWVQHIVNFAVTTWERHPVQAGASAVWVQVGIGLLLLVAPRGRWSRAGGVISVGWALVVWAVGEAFGGIFAPGLTWFFGAPGAVLFYAVAGALVALPERAWSSPKLGRGILAVMGAFFVGMAVLQAWPGRGFWQGQPHTHAPAGALTTMVQQMSQTAQPGFLSSWVSHFGAFDAAHGWGVNLFAVVALAAIGLAFLSGRRRLVLGAVIAGVVLCVADWVLIEDLGFLGGVGTDPNSMLPMALVFVSGYVAMVRVPATAPAHEATAAALMPEPPATVPLAGTAPAAPSIAGTAETGTWWQRLNPTYALRALAALGSVAIVLIGAVPMASASANPNADPILAEAVDGPPNLVNFPAPSFHLVDQRGRTVTLRSLRGRTVAMTFIDPVCTSDCPTIAQEMRLADGILGVDARSVDMLAVVANPIYRSLAVVQAFDRQEGLDRVPNWHYLTGSVAELQHVWASYAVEVGVEPAGAMVAHSEATYVIDPSGQVRAVLGEGQNTSAAPESSFAGELSSQLERVLAS